MGLLVVVGMFVEVRVVVPLMLRVFVLVGLLVVV